MFNRWLSYFRKRRVRRQYEAVVNHPQPQTQIQQLRALLACWDPDELARISLPTLRQTAVDTLHPDIYHLLEAIYSSRRYMRSREAFPAELVRGRLMRYEVRLYERNLESYLVDVEQRIGDRFEIFGELRNALQGSLNYLELEIGPQDRFYDYYVRQNVNLFDELAVILKAYLQARFV